MSEWRYVARRLNGDGTSTLIDPDLPLRGPSLTRVLSGPDGLSAAIDPAYTRLVGDDGRPVLQRYSTAIFAEQGGAIRHGTILTDITRTRAGLSLTGIGFTGYLKGLPYQGDVFFVQTDPLDIVRHIWAYAQGRPGGNLGMVLDQRKVGRLIGTELKQVEFDTQAGPVSFEAGPYKLNWWETDDLGGNVDTLATEQGFDYQERHGWNADETDVEHHLDFGVPRIGTRRADLRFVVGENVIVDPSQAFSGESYASEVIVRGAGEGRTMIRGFASRTGETRLARPQVVEDSSIKSVTAANARAKAELSMRQGLPEISEVQVLDHTHAPIGSWAEGDEILVNIDTEWGTTSDWFRVLSTTITPEDLSVAKLAVARADTITA